MKRKTKKQGKLKRTAYKTSAASKSMTALQKANTAKKAIKLKLATLKAELKQKLQNAAATAYEKAMKDFHREHISKAEAKQKILAAAEAKFEKKFAKKLSKQSKKRSHKNHTIATPAINMAARHTTHTASATRQKRRGRPRKVA